MEYEFDGQATLTWVHFVPDAKARRVAIPIMQDLGAEFDSMRERVQQVCYAYRGEPERAAARLWDVLWTLTARTSKRAQPQTMLGRAFHLIEQRLSQPIAIGELADTLEISHTHLNRLFDQAVHMTISEYIRHRRMEAAKHLLTHTTMPIKSIAAQLGISDAHHFNKLVKRYLGRAPRDVRAGGAVRI